MTRGQKAHCVLQAAADIAIIQKSPYKNNVKGVRQMVRLKTRVHQ
jgi:hypothetical protein